MYKHLLVGLLLLVTAQPALGQVYRPNEPLGKTLSKIKPLSTPNNAGGKGILENSCIFKNNGFSLSASEPLLDHCDVPEAIGRFVEKKRPTGPDRQSAREFDRAGIFSPVQGEPIPRQILRRLRRRQDDLFHQGGMYQRKKPDHARRPQGTRRSWRARRAGRPGRSPLASRS